VASIEHRNVSDTSDAVDSDTSEYNLSNDMEISSDSSEQYAAGNESVAADKGIQLSSGQEVTSTTVDQCELSDSNFDNITVLSTHNDGSVRKYDKKPYCLYCGTEQAQIARHWFSKHNTEAEVVEIENTKDRAQKRLLICKLRNMGNHSHNCKVRREGSGDFLVTHRPKSGANAWDYRPCEHCFAYLHKKVYFVTDVNLPKRRPGVALLRMLSYFYQLQRVYRQRFMS
jgi:hypothetical protein